MPKQRFRLGHMPRDRSEEQHWLWPPLADTSTQFNDWPRGITEFDGLELSREETEDGIRRAASMSLLDKYISVCDVT